MKEPIYITSNNLMQYAIYELNNITNLAQFCKYNSLNLNLIYRIKNNNLNSKCTPLIKRILEIRGYKISDNQYFKITLP